MTHAEATALISTLGLGFPRERFTLENAAVYERAIADLDASDVQIAVETLIRDQPRLPHVAELRAAAAKVKIARMAETPALPRRSLSELQEAAEWAGTAGRVTDAATRYERMVRDWYKSKGKAYPGDPGAGLVRAAVESARGNPVPFVAIDFTRGFR